LRENRLRVPKESSFLDRINFFVSIEMTLETFVMKQVKEKLWMKHECLFSKNHDLKYLISGKPDRYGEIEVQTNSFRAFSMFISHRYSFFSLSSRLKLTTIQ